MADGVSIKSSYDQVVKYEIKAECREPLHIGGGAGGRGEILVHPVFRKPFLPATGMAGAFREYFSYDTALQKALFGTQEEDSSSESKVRFTDGFFEKAGVYIELRPRVRIDRKTGTCQTQNVNGGTTVSGQKFEMEIISSGSEFRFEIYLYENKKESFQKIMEQALTALNQGMIQFGGQKSNGCGYVTLTSVCKTVYDMRNERDRVLWVDESKESEPILSQLVQEKETRQNRIQFELSGKTEGSILVKSLFVTDYDETAPDAENIRNHKKEFIIPASSVKGVVRSRIEKICRYKGLQGDTVERIFGKSGEKEEDRFPGCVRFYDCVIGDMESNDRAPSQKRIHIDKFTGGVMYQGLFSEKPTGGEIHIRVDLTDAADDKTKALVLLALRDIGIGILPLGGGSSIGRGFIKGEKLKVCDGAKRSAEIDFGNGTISGNEGMLNDCLAALQ